jgi:hypothetical protein
MPTRKMCLNRVPAAALREDFLTSHTDPSLSGQCDVSCGIALCKWIENRVAGLGEKFNEEGRKPR